MSDTGNDLVSIIVPTYRRNARLENALQNVSEQTYENTEVIVVDDSGEAHAQDVVDDHDVTYIAHEENEGPQAARNTGIRAASGRFIQLLDDDDELHERKIERQVPVLERRDEVGVVYCGLERGGVTVTPNREFRGDVLREALVFDHYPCMTATMLTERAVMERIMPLTRHTKDEVGMILELADVTRFDFVDEILVEKGVHADHRSQDPSFSREGIRIVDDYDYLYSRFPAEVRYRALQHQYRRYARTLLENERWSIGAVRAACTSVFWGLLSRDLDTETVLLAFVSVFGNVGYRTCRPLYRRWVREFGR